jgi:hypothetical protein
MRPPVVVVYRKTGKAGAHEGDAQDGDGAAPKDEGCAYGHVAG